MLLVFVGIVAIIGGLVYATRKPSPVAVTVPMDTTMPAEFPLDAFQGGASGDFIGSTDTAISVDFSDIATPLPSSGLDLIFLKYGTMYNLDPALLRAVAMVESSMNPNAKRINPPRDVSVGLMQILCLPDGKGGCTNKFNIDGWEGITFNKLFDADLNVKLGAQILAWNIKTFGYKRGIAVYNSWSARNDPPNGPFMNQGYVDKVFKNLNR